MVVSAYGNIVQIGVRESRQLDDWGAEKNTLAPFNLKINFGSSSSCYFLKGITVEGYGQYNKWADLVFRLKLDGEKRIHAYKVKASGVFDPNSPVGSQPEGYPARPNDCP